MMSDYIVLAALLLSNALVPVITIYCASQWKKQQQKFYQKLRKDLIARMQQQERRQFLIAHELERDAHALQLACMELAEARDGETDERLFGGDWMKVRDQLRHEADVHSYQASTDKLIKTYSVPIEEV